MSMNDGPPLIVAAFDLDGTLTEGGSVFKWLRCVGGNRRAWSAAMARSVQLSWGVLRSGPAADRAKESLFRGVLAGRSDAEVSEQSRRFAEEHLATHARETYVARLKWHLDEGHRVVVVSASPELYVKVVAGLLGAHGAIGTRLAADPLGRLTGGYLGRNCRGEEKLRRLHEWIERQEPSGEIEIYAYGNSRGDRRMLEGAQHPIDAGKLGAVGALRRYPRLSDVDQ
jgi:phosphatidylglycerophosphatase C